MDSSPQASFQWEQQGSVAAQGQVEEVESFLFNILKAYRWFIQNARYVHTQTSYCVETDAMVSMYPERFFCMYKSNEFYVLTPEEINMGKIFFKLQI